MPKFQKNYGFKDLINLNNEDLNNDSLAQARRREPKLVKFESLGHEEPEFVLKILCNVCEQNNNTKHLATRVSAA